MFAQLSENVILRVILTRVYIKFTTPSREKLKLTLAEIQAGIHDHSPNNYPNPDNNPNPDSNPSTKLTPNTNINPC